MRDALSLLELCAGNSGNITVQTVRESVGIGGREKITETINAIATGNYASIFSAIEEIVRSSVDISVFFNDLIAFYRDMLVIKTVRDGGKFLDITDSEMQALSAAAELFTKESLVRQAKLLEEALAAFWRNPAIKKTTAELALIKMCDASLDTSTDALLERIAKLETAVMSGEARKSPAVIVKKENERKADAGETQRKAPQSVDKSWDNAAQSARDSSKATAIRAWQDIVENSGFDPAAKSFLKKSRAYIDGESRIIIAFESDFFRDMILNEPNSSEKLAGIIGAYLKKSIAAGDVSLEVREAESEIPDDLADFV